MDNLFEDNIKSEEFVKRDEFQIPDKWSKDRRIKALKQILKGLKRYTDNHTITPEADGLQKTVEHRILAVERV